MQIIQMELLFLTHRLLATFYKRHLLRV